MKSDAKYWGNQMYCNGNDAWNAGYEICAFYYGLHFALFQLNDWCDDDDGNNDKTKWW